MSFDLKDSGERQEFPTGARRDLQDGKGRPDLIPTMFLQRLASVMEKGAAKYGDRNWEKGMPLSRYYASAMRHLMQAFNGEQDEDHLGQCAFNVAAFMWTQQAILEGHLPADLYDLPASFNPDPRFVKSFPVMYPGDNGAEVMRLAAASAERLGEKQTRAPGQYPGHRYANPNGLDLTDPVAVANEVADDSRWKPKWENPRVHECCGECEHPHHVEMDETQQHSMRDAGLVECLDGVWRPAAKKDESVKNPGEVQTPIYAQPTMDVLREGWEQVPGYDAWTKGALRCTGHEMRMATREDREPVGEPLHGDEPWGETGELT